MSVIDYDPIYEMDGGGLMGYLLYPEKGGEVTPEDVDWFINLGDGGEDFEEGGDFNAEEVWVRKVPGTDENGFPMTRYVYGGPGPGARYALRVEQHSTWGHWCVNHIYEPAATGIPVEQVLDPPWPMVLRGYVYLCRPCCRSFSERMEAARAEALTELRRKEVVTP